MQVPEKRKILYCITKSNWGGAQRYVFDLATGVDHSRFQVKVLLGGNGMLREKLNASGIPVLELPQLERDVKFTRDGQVFFRLFRLFRKERPDVVHLNSSKIGALGAIAARFAGVPTVIFTAHGWAFNENRPDSAKALLMVIYWITFLFCTKVIAVSEGLRNDVRRYPFVQQKFTVIHNGVSHIAFKEKSSARLLLAPNAPPSAHWIGTIAELHHIKGLDYAIRAISIVAQKHNVIFVIIGEGEERARLETLVAELKLEGRVFFAGHVADAATYLKAFDTFTLTSLSEGLCYAVIEAGAAEIPVVASRVGGIPEVVDGVNSGILIWPKHVKEIVHAVEFLLAHPEKAQFFAATLKKEVETKFSIQKMIAETSMLY
jgi:glycosyltransferase involved in cell wall biosynthesis